MKSYLTFTGYWDKISHSLSSIRYSDKLDLGSIRTNPWQPFHLLRYYCRISHFWLTSRSIWIWFTFFQICCRCWGRYFWNFMRYWAFLDKMSAFVQLVCANVRLFRLDWLPGGLLFRPCWSEFDRRNSRLDDLCVSLVTAWPWQRTAHVLGIAQVVHAFRLAQMPKD